MFPLPEKPDYMKSSLLLSLMALLAFQACELVEDNLSFGIPHVYGPRTNSRTGQPLDSISPGGPTPPLPSEPVMYLSAVRVPAGYDWRRDTAYGAIDAEIVLLRGFREVLSIPTGRHVSTAADRHHIINGHLYTECQTSDATYIGRDGAELFSITGREELKGLLEKDGAVLTLTQPLGGDGFCLRSNGQTVLSKKNGSVFGSMEDPSYSPNGSLYEDNGECCFCFKDNAGLFKVQDGSESVFGGILSAVAVKDIRVLDGKEIYALGQNAGMAWESASLWPQRNGYAIGGLVKPVLNTAVYHSSDGSVELYGGGDAAVYVGDGYSFSIRHSRDGTTVVSDKDGNLHLDGKWYFLSQKCAAPGPKGPALALTPFDAARKPVVIYDGQTHEIDINGFLTGISFQ